MKARVEEIGGNHELLPAPFGPNNPETPLGDGQLSDNPPPVRPPRCSPRSPVGAQVPDPASLVKLEDPAAPEVVHELPQRMVFAPILHVEMPGKLFQADPQRRILGEKRQNAFFQ